MIKSLCIFVIISAIVSTPLRAEEKEFNEIDPGLINEFYEFLWLEILNSTSKPKLTQPNLENFTEEKVLESLTGKWQFNDKGPRHSNVHWIHLEKAKKWKEIFIDREKEVIHTGYWVAYANKVALFRENDKLRAFILLIDGIWFWNDADVEGGIARLINTDCQKDTEDGAYNSDGSWAICE